MRRWSLHGAEAFPVPLHAVPFPRFLAPFAGPSSCSVASTAVRGLAAMHRRLAPAGHAGRRALRQHFPGNGHQRQLGRAAAQWSALLPQTAAVLLDQRRCAQAVRRRSLGGAHGLDTGRLADGHGHVPLSAAACRFAPGRLDPGHAGHHALSVRRRAVCQPGHAGCRTDQLHHSCRRACRAAGKSGPAVEALGPAGLSACRTRPARQGADRHRAAGSCIVCVAGLATPLDRTVAPAVAARPAPAAGRGPALVRADGSALSGLSALLLHLPALPAFCGNRLQQPAWSLVLSGGAVRADAALVAVADSGIADCLAPLAVGRQPERLAGSCPAAGRGCLVAAPGLGLAAGDHGVLFAAPF